MMVTDIIQILAVVYNLRQSSVILKSVWDRGIHRFCSSVRSDFILDLIGNRHDLLRHTVQCERHSNVYSDSLL